MLHGWPACSDSVHFFQSSQGSSYGSALSCELWSHSTAITITTSFRHNTNLPYQRFCTRFTGLKFVTSASSIKTTDIFEGYSWTWAPCFRNVRTSFNGFKFGHLPGHFSCHWCSVFYHCSQSHETPWRLHVIFHWLSPFPTKKFNR